MPPLKLVSLILIVSACLLSGCSRPVPNPAGAVPRAPLRQEHVAATDGEQLRRAAATGDVVKVAALLAKGVNVDSADANGYTALHMACRNGSVATVEALLGHHANPNMRTADIGVTPLHLAAAGGRTAVVEVLLKAGADPSLTSRDGSTPADFASIAKHPDTVAAFKRK